MPVRLIILLFLILSLGGLIATCRPAQADDGARTIEEAHQEIGGFKWWRACRNPRLDRDHTTVHHHLSLAFWAALFILLSTTALVGLVHLVRSSRNDPPWIFDPVIWGLLLVAVFGFGYAGFRAADPGGIVLISDALRPALDLAWLDALWQGLWHDLFRFLPWSEWVIFATSILFAVIELVLVYVLAALWCRDRRAGWIAAALVGLSTGYLGFFATDVMIHPAAALLSGFFLSMYGALRWGSPALGLAVLPLSFAAGLLLPALCLLSLPVLIGLRWETASRRARLGVLGLALGGMGLGLIPRVLWGDQPLFPVALGRSWGGAPSAFLMAALLIGAYVSWQKRRPLPFLGLLAAVTALVCSPSAPPAIAKSDSWRLIAVILAAPLAAEGILGLARWAGRRPVWISLGWILAIAIPWLVAAVIIEETPVQGAYRFQKEVIGELSRANGVLYFQEAGPPSAFPLADFLAPPGSKLCLRPRDRLAKDPKSHGEQWLFFGTGCAGETTGAVPAEDECRFYRFVYRLDGELSKTLIFRDADGRPVRVESLSFARVEGPRRF